MDNKRAALIFKAFYDENRIRIVKLLRTGKMCACKLLEEVNVTQPTLSHHMKILCDSGIVVAEKRAIGCTTPSQQREQKSQRTA